MAGAATSLEVREVDVFYGTLQVLNRVSLSARGGEFIALLGSSGCGKTTLLRAICGFVPVERGVIAVGGGDITKLPPDKRNMAMVFQSYALWPHMTVAQNIGYGLKLRGASRTTIADRVEQMLAMLRLGGLGARKVTELSGGQRQRVALGRALAISPQILLLDEPLSNLDARVREQVRHEIKTLQRDLGITTVHVTHDREEAMVMADQIAILDAGRVAQVGAPEEVYNRPNSPFVASFMGAGNAIKLPAEPNGRMVLIPEGPHNSAATIDATTVDGAALERLAGARGLVAFFRSEDARLQAAETHANGSLVLRGEIVQASYPGGYYRYAIKVGSDQFLVDDARRHAVGEPIGIALSLSALHFYPEAAASLASPALH
ncbi:MAG TPA: ABC transporter ATP-binding protein [Stellaceae bacterium]|jgi:ABC-type Fe3+/spermidine/putrescine transport system ATPase subunit|nr:ABC transporter ATP-binding protein [Stellaceae bacterium]